jgi:hypothetical protein
VAALLTPRQKPGKIIIAVDIHYTISFANEALFVVCHDLQAGRVFCKVTFFMEVKFDENFKAGFYYGCGTG